MSELPHKFLTRAVRRFAEMLTEEKTGRTSGTRCNHEHANEAEATGCGKVHMRYDEEDDYGIFGEDIPCVEFSLCGGEKKCECSAPTAPSSSSGSGSDSDGD
jgi:hypothetical protein